MFHWVRLRLFYWYIGNVLIVETSRKKKQLSETETVLRCKETAQKGMHLSKKELKTEKVRISSLMAPSLPLPDACASVYKAEAINSPLEKKSCMRNRRNPLASEEGPMRATHAGNGTPTEGEIDKEENGEAAAAATAGTLAGATAQVL